MAAASKSCNSNQSNCELVGRPSMSKWTRNVSTAMMVLMMVVICVLPTAIEGKSLYGEEAAAAAAAQHEVGDLEHERQQPSSFGLEKSGGIGDLMDYGTGRDEYDGGPIVAAALPENPLLNYLYARQMLQRLRPGSASFLDQPYASYYLSPQQQKQQLDGIRKRTSTYWKQCAFNAVSCFGK